MIFYINTVLTLSQSPIDRSVIICQQQSPVSLLGILLLNDTEGVFVTE
jgi:hypothetical protein